MTPGEPFQGARRRTPLFRPTLESFNKGSHHVHDDGRLRCAKSSAEAENIADRTTNGNHEMRSLPARNGERSRIACCAHEGLFSSRCRVGSPHVLAARILPKGAAHASFTVHQRQRAVDRGRLSRCICPDGRCSSRAAGTHCRRAARTPPSAFVQRGVETEREG